MKKYSLYITVRVEVDSQLPSLNDTIQEFEQETSYSFSDTENVRVSETEILITEIFKPSFYSHGTQY